MKKIRILFAIPNFLTAGSGREMFNIVERLDKQIFEPYVAVQQSGGNLYDEIVKKGYPVLVSDFMIDERRSMYHKIAGARNLSRFFRDYKFDIWQSFNWSSDFTEALVARWAGAQYVYVKKNMNWHRRAWKVKSLLSAAIVARNTTLIQKYFSGNLFAGKTFYVPGGVQVRNLTPSSHPGFRVKIGIPAGATLISCIAQLVRVKDQATLILAASKFDNCYVVLAGAERDKVYAQELKELVARNSLNNRVFFIGPIDNVYDLLVESDMFVLPTTSRNGHEEGCPVALLEAMSAGVPCIASNVAGSRDLIDHEECGFLFPPENIDALTQCIRKYIDQPQLAKKLAAVARRKVEDKYTLELEADRFASMYKKLTISA